MATRMLYHEDGALLETEAALVRQEAAGNGCDVVLDRTILFPGGGGQPADRGWIEDREVTGYAGGDDVVHRVAGPLEGKVPGDTVRVRVDAARRRESSQQHTGQHIVSACLLAVGGWGTVSVHMGEDVMTVESPVPHIPEADLHAVEARANEIVCRNLPVRTHLVDAEGLARFRLRRPAAQRDLTRVVEIEGHDASACGGVHVGSTGEVGLIAWVGSEKIRGNCRSLWLVGDRAYRDYAGKTTLVRDLGAELSSPPAGLLESVRRLRAELAELRERAERLEAAAAAGEAERLAASARSCGAVSLVVAAMHGASRSFLRAVGVELSRRAGTVAILASLGADAADLLACRSDAVDLDLGALLAPHLALVSAKGGGRAGQWQGSAREPARLEELFAAVELSLRASGG